MIDLLSMTQVILKEAGFTMRLRSIDRSSVVRFEDETVLGFGCVFNEPADLLKRWRTTEMAILQDHAAFFRRAGEKSWNVYCVFLCSSPADPIQRRQVRWIEEDLERTRKVTGCGITTREELVRVLLPLLPIQYLPFLKTEDVTERLQRRIRDIAPRASDVALDESVPVEEVVRLLGVLA